MNKCIMPSSHAPGIQLKKGEAKGSKNMMGQVGVGNMALHKLGLPMSYFLSLFLSFSG